MLRSSQNSTESALSEENVKKLQEAIQEEQRKQDRIKLMEKILIDEKDCWTKLKIRVRIFCLWLYNKQ
jgi:hypothetical protein